MYIKAYINFLIKKVDLFKYYKYAYNFLNI